MLITHFPNAETCEVLNKLFLIKNLVISFQNYTIFGFVTFYGRLHLLYF